MARPPVTRSVFEDAQAWLAKHVNAYRSLHPGMDVVDALQALDRIGYTPFGFSRSGELGYATEPGFRPVRPSQLSHRLGSSRFQWMTRKPSR